MSGRTGLKVWRAFVRRIGGFYRLGPYEVLLHDDGVLIGRDLVVRWEWRFAPPPVLSARSGTAEADQ